MSETKQRGIIYATLYGYPVSNLGVKNCDAYAATQTVIWEFAQGYRTLSGRTNSTLFDGSIKGTPAESAYHALSEAVMGHAKIPSFHNTTATLEYDASVGKYKAVLTDSNGQLASFDVTSGDSRIALSKSGNTLTLTADDYFSDSIVLNFRKNTVPNGGPQALMLLFHETGQKCVTGSMSDPVIANLTVKSIPGMGNVRLQKTSEDGTVSGISFTISGNGTTRTVTTDAQGEILFEGLLPGEYTVTEAAPDKYAPVSIQKVTVVSGGTAAVAFSNVLKKFRVEVAKSDSESGTAQGNAKLSGAVYGLYKGGQFIDSFTTDPNGAFTTGYYVCAEDWTLREITPGEGYLLDPAVHKIGADPKLFSVERNTVPVFVREDVVKGRILIVKHTDDGSTGIETPEAGAAFEIYLTGAGSYDQAKSTERDLLLADENGFAASNKDLPYGWYTVHQRSGWAGRTKIPDFQVYVSEHGKTYTYIINNATFKSKIKIEKRDAETGKLIASAGVGFQIGKPDAGLLTQTIYYPTPTDISVFYTNEEGWLMLPYPLDYGVGYQLIEVQAAPPYVLNREPVRFDVTGENPNALMTVTMLNRPQRGKLTVRKSGEVFSSVREENGLYVPVYAVQGLPGTRYEIYAEENIYVNHDLKHGKGDFVGTMITDAQGIAVLENLCLGKYRGVETASHGYVKGEDFTFELTYAGQEAEISENEIFLRNERQKVQIDLAKEMERDESFGIGMNGEILSVKMGLYADADLIAADGKKIPKDGLIARASVAENGRAVFSADLPVGSRVYIREIAAHEGYRISGDPFPLVFKYAGQETATVHLTANGGESIENRLIRGRIEGRKLDEDASGLAGALIGLFRPEETEFTENTALMTAKSGQDGSFSFEAVPYGEWLIREIAAPKAFVLSEKSYPMTISIQGETVEIEMKNRLIRGSIKTTKTDLDYPQNRLSGAVFDVYADADGNGVFDESADPPAGTLTESEPGVYRLEGLVWGGYFLHERTAPAQFVRDERYYFFEIRMDGETVEVENNAGVGFANRPVTGELWLTKKDVSTGALIPGCGVRIKNENGSTVTEGRTDENGELRFLLRAGKYTYSEFDAPKGYLLDESEFPFEIRQDGEIIKAEMTNKRIPQPENPKTGNGNVGFLIGLAAAVLGGGIACIAMSRKKRK